jgi:hypothetical protein
VYDGYLIGVASGGFGPYGYVTVDRNEEFEFGPDLRPLNDIHQVAIDDPRRVVRECPVPVIEFQSQEEAVSHLWHQRPDSDAPGDLYRCYQIPARGHESGLLDDGQRVADFEDLGIHPDGTSTFATPVRHTATRWLLAAAVENLIAWTDGIAPPRADPIRLVARPGTQRDMDGVDYRAITIVPDAAGHALGGVRHLDVDLPVRTMAGDPDGPVAMQQWTHTPFGEDELRRRYGSMDGLRSKARTAVARLVAERWYLPEDAAPAVNELCSDAARAWW